MNQTQLEQAIFDRTHIPRATIRRLLSIYTENLVNQLPHGNIVRCFGFGSYASVRRNAGHYNNPRTGARTFVSVRAVINWTPGENLLKIANGLLTP